MSRLAVIICDIILLNINTEGTVFEREILEILKENRDSFVSGQEISNKLGITRAAVWKHIKRLENDGYKIESMSKNGYKLVHCPDVLTYEEIKDTLKSKIIGQRIVHFDTLGSTSEKARELAECGEKEGTIIIAEEQSDGRGRIGRKWFSQNRLGIWMSVILRPGIRMNEVPLRQLLRLVGSLQKMSKLNGLTTFFLMGKNCAEY